MAIGEFSGSTQRNDASLLPGAPASEPKAAEPILRAEPRNNTPAVTVGAAFQPFAQAIGLFRAKVGAKWTNQAIGIALKTHQGLSKPNVTMVLTKNEIYALKQLCASVDSTLDMIEQSGGQSVLRLKIGRWLIPNSVPKITAVKPIAVHLEMHKGGVRATLATEDPVTYAVHPKNCTVDFVDLSAIKGQYLVGDEIRPSGSSPASDATKPMPNPAQKQVAENLDKEAETMDVDSHAAEMAQQLL